MVFLVRRVATGRGIIRQGMRPAAFFHMIGPMARVWGIVFRIQLARLTVDHFMTQRADTMTAHDIIRTEVLSWPGVTEEPHRFGGMEFRLGKRELGHLHGDYLADLPFPVRIREELVREGKAMPHHILPQSGWVSYPIRDARAIPGALDLFRLAYARATKTRHGSTEDTEDTERTEKHAGEGRNEEAGD